MTEKQDLSTDELGALMRSWNTATAAHRAQAERRARAGEFCLTCYGTGVIGKRKDGCLCCDGRGKGARW